MDPVDFSRRNAMVAENQDEYRTLPSYQNGTENVSCWRLSFRERLYLLFNGVLWIRQMNFGGSVQPILPQVDDPFADGSVE